MNSKLYKSEAFASEYQALYQDKRTSLSIATESRFVETSFGKTHVLVAGPEQGEPLVLIHGLNAGAPTALDAIQELSKTKRIYALDTIGQCGFSAETRLPVHDLSYGKWLAEVIQKLGLNRPDCVSVSFGAYVLLNVLKFDPNAVNRCVFVVPSGFTNSAAAGTMLPVFASLIWFQVLRSDTALKSFCRHFYTQASDFDLRMQRILLTGVHMDYRRPPELKPADVQLAENEIFLLTAETDVFFPSAPSIEKAKKCFKNVRETRVEKGWKHVPPPTAYAQISQTISDWLT